MSHNRHNFRAVLKDTETRSTMEPYQIFAEELTALLDGAESVEITVGDHPPLFVDIIDDEVSATETRRFIILTQSAVINDQYARDPKVVFLVSHRGGIPLAKPIGYENDRTEAALAACTLSPTGAWIPNDPAICDRVYELAVGTLKDVRARGYFDAKAVRVTR